MCVLGSGASASHSQIYNQAQDELPSSSASLTSAFHQNKLPHLLPRWLQTLSRRALSWQSDVREDAGAMARPAPAAEVHPEPGKKKTAGLTFEIIHYEKAFRFPGLLVGMRRKENMWTDLYIMKCRWGHLSISTDNLKGHSFPLKTAKKHANGS